MRFRLPPMMLTTVVAAMLTAVLGAQTYPGTPNDHDQDPPSRVARLAALEGNVSLEPAGVDTFSAAELNYPLTVGDRLYADNNALTELQTFGLSLRLGNGADLTLTALTDTAAQFGLAQGSIRLRTRDLSAPDGSQSLVEVDTPNGAIVVLRAGDLRVDSYPQDDTTVVTVTSGQVEVSAAGPNGEYTETLNPGQSLRLAGANPVYAERVRPLDGDTLDRFAQNRERQRQQSLAAAGQYADSDMVGLSDLGQYGDWAPDNDFGQVWYPRAVPANWTPYSDGHWAWVAPWGWTWVDAEPWGFAPFHYGRWASFNGRWGWVPGPPPTVLRPGGYGDVRYGDRQSGDPRYGDGRRDDDRPIRSVYSPALVAFVGGPQLSISIGGGSGRPDRDGGVTAWFPLGPREVYTPWYHASPGYVNRVNVTNLYNRNVTEVHNTYINRTTNVYNTNVTNVTYVNRPAATVAVQQRDFAAGRTVRESQPVRLDDRARQQLDRAPILPHPLVTPAVGSAAPAAPPRALPPSQGRPILVSHPAENGKSGLGIRGPDNGGPGNSHPGNSGQTNGGQGNRPGTFNGYSPADRNSAHPVQTLPQRVTNDPSAIQPTQSTPNSPRVNPQMVPDQRPGSRALPGLKAPQPPATQLPVAPPQPARGSFPNRRDHQPLTATPAPVATPSSQLSPQQPPTRPADRQGRPMMSAAPFTPPQAQPQPQQRPTAAAERQQPRPPDPPRPLENRNPPQQPQQPPFVQQQRAIERTDPGRPLNPRQVDNLRNNQPAGPAREPDPRPHPAPAAPPARTPPPPAPKATVPSTTPNAVPATDPRANRSHPPATS